MSTYYGFTLFSMGINKTSWTMVMVAMLMVVLSFVFGMTLSELSRAIVVALEGGTPGAFSFSLPIVLILLLSAIRLAVLFIRPWSALGVVVVCSAIAIGLGWGQWTPLLVFLLPYMGCIAAYTYVVERHRQLRIRFTPWSTRAGQVWVSIAVVMMIATAVWHGGQVYMEGRSLALPEEQIERLSLYFLKEVIETDRPTDRTHTILLEEMEGQMEEVFERFVQPQERNLVGMIVLVLLFPLLLIMVPLHWIALGVVVLVIWVLLRVGVLRKYPHIKDGYDVQVVS